ncbi:Actin/actin-like protein [Aureobasidium pullulans]|uniref:Actin/actin-like protein n=1 Tax=Aureobasidium pullulans TaxID=5580 RepID=A0A4S9WGB4_AURPU|nr:Actin/actin-like protein [Aureobasidium pullulans]
MNSYNAPAPQEYAGDEINALVLDPGSFTTRAGFAGEDTPKSVIPSFYGSIAAADADSQSRYLFGENAIHSPLPNMEIRSPYDSDGIVEDWDAASRLWEYSITSRLTGARPTPAAKNGLNDDTEDGDKPADGDGDVAMEGIEEQEKPMSEHPLLMSEPAWNPAKNRAKCIEIALEDWGAPAFWLGKTGVLAAFAAGKPNALVIDVGASTTSVTPVHDGFVLKKGIQKSSLGGNFVSQQLRLQFSKMDPVAPLVPHYMVKSKSPVDAGQPSNAEYMKFDIPPTDSFRKNEEERIFTSFKESMVQVWQGPGKLDQADGVGNHPNINAVKDLPSRPFEMPDGWNQVFGIERFRVAEGLFDAKAALTDDNHPAPDQKHTITQMVQAALTAVDVEVRPLLLNNIVLTGGGSLLDKLAERLHGELSALYPNPRVRVNASNLVTDRKYGSWVGGSILASLGTFHQMWISKKEYEEHGSSIIEKRCK